MRGVERLGEGAVKGKVKLTEGRPLDRNAVQQSRASIDSLYKNAGYYAAEVKALELPQQNGKIRVVFDVKEGERVAISQVVIDGNKHFTDQSVVHHMATQPEGFFWYQKGEYDEDKLEEDERERLPRWYADRGFVDFQVTSDCLHADGRWEGRPPPHRGRGAGLPRRHLRHGGQPALLPRGAAGLLPVRSPVADRGHRREAAVQPDRVGRGHRKGPEPLRQQRLHLRPGGARGEPADRAGRHAGGGSAVDHPGRLARHDQQDRDRGERRHP